MSVKYVTHIAENLSYSFSSVLTYVVKDKPGHWSFQSTAASSVTASCITVARPGHYSAWLWFNSLHAGALG